MARPVTLALVVANAAWFFATLPLNAEDFYALTQVNSAVLERGEAWRLFTSIFVHFDAVHLFSNLLGLVLFGLRVEDLFGRWKTLVVYFGSGIFANVVDLALLPANVASAGASGCIYGLIGAYYVGVGRHDKRLLQQGVVATLVYAALSYRPGVNPFAHLFGAVGGILLALLFTRGAGTSGQRSELERWRTARVPGY